MNFYDERNPKCIKSYITYMDILGYSNMILQYKGESLLNTFNAIKDSKKVLKLSDMGVETKVKVKMFSDNVIAATPVPHVVEENMACKFLHMYQAARCQYILCYNGFLARGGFVIDDLYIDDDIVFGKGILNVHHLEDKVAIYPRIILDENTYSELCQTDSWVPVNKYICRDVDGILYIDFLNILYIYEVVLTCYYDDYYEKLRELFWNQIFPLQDVILKNIVGYKDNEKILKKYEWFAKYFKKFCNENYPHKILKI